MDENITGRMPEDPYQNAQQTKCPACGGVMRYSPAKQALECLYCGHVEKIDITPVPLEGHPYKERSGQEPPPFHPAEACEVKCRQCGATVTLAENVTAARCPFCGTSLILDDAQNLRSEQPEYILPFSIDEKQAREAYKKWLAGKWWAPGKLRKNVADTNSFQGVYLPFWAYAAEAGTDYVGARGERRTRTRRVNGKTETYTETEWYRVSGHVDNSFDFADLLIPGSSTLPADIMEKLRAWDFDHVVAFDPKFLSGFVSELYSKDQHQAWGQAQQEAQQVIDQDIRRDIGGDEQRIEQSRTTYSEVMFLLMQLPVWVSSFRYGDKLYQFVVNGRTGEVQGHYPKSTLKIVLVTLLVIAAAVALYYFLNQQ